MTVPVILIVFCLITAAYVGLTIRVTRFWARKLSMVFPLIVCYGYAIFYILVARGGGPELASFSRWLLLGTLTTFTIQAWAIRQSERLEP